MPDSTLPSTNTARDMARGCETRTRHRITVTGSDTGRLEIDTESGGIYFVELQVYGETQSEATTRFRRVAPDSGKTAILGCCRMLEAWRPGQSRFNY